MSSADESLERRQVQSFVEAECGFDAAIAEKQFDPQVRKCVTVFRGCEEYAMTKVGPSLRTVIPFSVHSVYPPRARGGTRVSSMECST